MSVLYRPSKWEWCAKAKKMVRRNPGKRVNGLHSKAPIRSQLVRLGS